TSPAPGRATGSVVRSDDCPPKSVGTWIVSVDLRRAPGVSHPSEVSSYVNFRCYATDRSGGRLVHVAETESAVHVQQRARGPLGAQDVIDRLGDLVGGTEPHQCVPSLDRVEARPGG